MCASTAIPGGIEVIDFGEIISVLIIFPIIADVSEQFSDWIILQEPENLSGSYLATTLGGGVETSLLATFNRSLVQGSVMSVPVPEPSILPLFLAGAFTMLVCGWRRRIAIICRQRCLLMASGREKTTVSAG
jgi:hypothetical protein